MSSINQNKFLPSNKITKDEGLIQLNGTMSWCYNGILMSSVYFKFKKIICTEKDRSYANDVIHINPLPTKTLTFSPVYDLPSGQYVLAASSTESLMLYYKIESSGFGLFLYNFETVSESQIFAYDYINSISVSIAWFSNEITKCQFLFGSFESKSQLDLFIDCSLLSLQQVFLLKDNNYQEGYSLPRELCVNKVKLGDFNGDKYTDFLCLGAHPKIIFNTGGGFQYLSDHNIVNINLQKATYSNWGLSFLDGSSLYIGDFDGDGISDIFSVDISPMILHGHAYYTFVSHNINANGAFSINGLTSWCDNELGRSLLIADFNNDRKDDILCNSGGKTYLMFSYSNSIVYDMRRVEIELIDFSMSPKNNDVYSTYKSSPLICNASKIVDPKVYTTCSIKSKDSITKVNLFINLPKTVAYASINSQINTQLVIDTSDYSKVKIIDSFYNQSFIRNRIISIKNKDLSSSLNIIMPASWCKIIEPRYLVIKKYFSAKGSLKGYYNDGTLVRDISILKSMLGASNITILDSLDVGVVKFAAVGEIEFNTLDFINSKNCDLVDLPETSHENFYLIQKAATRRLLQNTSTSKICGNTGNANSLSGLGYNLNENNAQTQLVLMNRTDLIDMHGYVYTLNSFLPNNFLKSNMSLANHNVDHYDSKSVIFYNNNNRIVSTISLDDKCPRMTIFVSFHDANGLVGAPIPYAGFDNIKSVKTEALTISTFVMMWSIYLHKEFKFFMFFDYISDKIRNTLYRVSSYDGNFNSITVNNSLIVSYMPNQYELNVIKFFVNNNTLQRAQNYSYSFENPQLDFKLRLVDNSTFYLLWSHKNSKGIFMQKFDYNLRKVSFEKNIICFPSSFDADFYNNWGAVVWQDLARIATKSSYYIQTINGDLFINSKNIFNTFGAQVENVEIVNFSSSMKNSSSSFSNIGYLLVIKNGTDYISAIYNNNLELKSVFLNDNSNQNIQGLGLTSEYFSNTNNTEIAKANQVNTNNQVETFALNTAKNSKIEAIQNVISDALTVYTAIATASSGSCSCICSLETKAQQFEYKAKQFRNYAHDLEQFGLKSESLVVRGTKDVSLFFEVIAERLRLLRGQLQAGIATLEELETKLGIKSLKNALGKEISVLGKQIPIIDIIFTAQFLIEEIISINHEEGAVSTRTLRLNFQSQSTIDGANLQQIEDLEDVINFIHDGLVQTILFIQQAGSPALTNYTAYTRSLICNSILPDAQILSQIQALMQLLEKRLYFTVHSDYDGITCKDDKGLYLVYRDGITVHICPNFDISDPDKHCRIFIKILRDASEFLLPFIIAPLLTNPLTAIIATTIVTLVISNALNDERTAEFCHIFTCMTTNNPVQIAIEVIKKIYVSDIEEELSEEFKTEIQNIKNKISALIQDIDDSDKLLQQIGDIIGIFEILVEKVFLDGASSVVGAWIYSKIENVCHEHHSTDHTKLIYLSAQLITGLISQKQEQEVSIDSCKSMAQYPRCCGESNDQVANPLCLTHLVITTATAFNFTNALNSQSDSNLELYCSHGCVLEEVGLNSLMTILGGYYE